MKTLYLLLLCSHSVIAQSPKQDFTKAEEFYKNGNFTEAVTQTERVKKSLGKSNPKVEALLFMAYYNTKDYTKAKVAYETLKLMVPDNVENSDAFKLYKSTGEQLDKKLAEIQTTFEKKQNESTQSLYDDSKYEDRNAYKEDRIKRKKEVYDRKIAIIQENNENEASQVLEQILENPTKEKFENYLLEERYESSFEDVEKYIKYWEEESFFHFNDSDEMDDIETLQYHLNLTFLNIAGEKIKYIPESISVRGTLLIIAINETLINELPENITNNKNLEILTLKDNNNLKNIVENFSYFPKLEQLIIQNNNSIDKIPSIGELKNLSEFHLNQYLKVIPDGVFKLKNLKELSLGSIRDNSGIILPEALGNLSNLEYLAIYHSNFSKLPYSIKNLKNLKNLNLYNTWIDDLPSELRSLSKLEKISVGGTAYKPYNHKKVERELTKLKKALPNLEVNYLN